MLETLKEKSIFIYLAPAEGLLLNTIDFGNYNLKKEIPELIEFTEQQEHVMLEFKIDVIYKYIHDVELEK